MATTDVTYLGGHGYSITVPNVGFAVTVGMTITVDSAQGAVMLQDSASWSFAGGTPYVPPASVVYEDVFLADGVLVKRNGAGQLVTVGTTGLTVTRDFQSQTNLAAGATYTGDTLTPAASSYVSITESVRADQPFTLSAEDSTDGVTWIKRAESVAVLSGGEYSAVVQWTTPRRVRAKIVTTGASTTTIFEATRQVGQ
jgi:hypothetical protein